MWNMTQPEVSTPARGSTTARSASPASWRLDRGQQPQQQRRGDPDGDGAEREEDGDLGHGVNR